MNSNICMCKRGKKEERRKTLSKYCINNWPIILKRHLLLKAKVMICNKIYETIYNNWIVHF